MFILLIYRDPSAWGALTDAERAGVARGHDAFQRSVREMVFTEALAEPRATRTVRVRDGQVAVAHAPYLKTRSFLCGYYLIDSERLDRAIELAARVPEAHYAAVEVRELIGQFGTEPPYGLDAPENHERWG